MVKKRGQITFFVVLGLVILVIILLTTYFFIAAQPKSEQIPFEYGDINSFVTGCLDEAIVSGVVYCSGENRCPDEGDLGGQVVTSFFDCTGPRGEKIQEQFPHYEIKVGNADIDIVESTKQIKAALSFPVDIKRDNKEHMLKNFRSEYDLKAGACIPCPTCIECVTQEELEVTILDLTMKFEPQEFVGIRAGECLAC